MVDVTFKFPDDDSALDFLAYMQDGGGEYQFLDSQDCEDVQTKIASFDYSAAMTPGADSHVVIAVPDNE